MAFAENQMTGFIGSSLSERGFGHIQSNTVCQDASDYFIDEKGHFAIAVVCDGHGSAKHFRSDIGSKYAVEDALSTAIAFLGYAYKKENKDIDEKKILELEKNIIFKWNNSIEKHHAKNPITYAELSALNESDRASIEDAAEIYKIYGTTLILVAMTETYCFGMQIGDGDCLLQTQEGEIVNFMPDDDRLMFNVTTSLCDSNAIRNFRHFVSKEPIAAAVVSTDGVRNSFVGDDKYRDFISMVIDSFADSEINAAEEELREFLPNLSRDGSGDDVSITLILRDDMFQQPSSGYSGNAKEPVNVEENESTQTSMEG